MAFSAEHPGAKAVERPCRYVAATRTHQQAEPLTHLAGRLVREGDGQDSVRRYADLSDEVGDPVRHDAGLATARTGDDQQRPVDMAGRLALALGQTGEKVSRGPLIGSAFGCLYRHRQSLAAAPAITAHQTTSRNVPRSGREEALRSV